MYMMQQRFYCGIFLTIFDAAATYSATLNNKVLSKYQVGLQETSLVINNANNGQINFQNSPHQVSDI